MISLTSRRGRKLELAKIYAELARLGEENNNLSVSESLELITKKLSAIRSIQAEDRLGSYVINVLLSLFVSGVGTAIALFAKAALGI